MKTLEHIKRQKKEKEEKEKKKRRKGEGERGKFCLRKQIKNS